jgi:ABC-2 type transport system ATP-binding protein
MQDIEAIAERVILIGKGQILLDGSLQELRNAATGEVVQAAEVKENTGDTAGGSDVSDGKSSGVQSGINLDHVMAALYKKLDIM